MLFSDTDAMTAKQYRQQLAAKLGSIQDPYTQNLIAQLLDYAQNLENTNTRLNDPKNPTLSWKWINLEEILLWNLMPINWKNAPQLNYKSLGKWLQWVIVMCMLLGEQ